MSDDGGPPSFSSEGEMELTNLDQQGLEHTIRIPSRGEPLTLPAHRPETCIYMVPRNLREVKPEAYTPQMVSIGPIHRGDENLRGMESYKRSYLKKLCVESGIQIDELWGEVRDREEQIRGYYEDFVDNVNDSSDSFIEMVLLDSAFMIMIMRTKYLVINQEPVPEESVHQPRPPDDYILSKPWRDYGVTRDLMLLENQLPYFILHDLYTFAFGEKATPFYDLACDYFQFHAVRPERDKHHFRSLCCFECVYNITDENNFERACAEEAEAEKHFALVKYEFQSEKHRHFTDLIRKFWSYKLRPKENAHYFSSVANMFTIADLNDAGVKFEMDHEAWPLKMEFAQRATLRRVLRMPRLSFHDDSECLIRNLMAYEQCHDPYNAYICEFFVFLGYLINTEKDVELLAKVGIITNELGDNAAVADVVKGLGKKIADGGNRYHSLYLELKAHCENGFYKTIAILRRVYFSNLWTATGTLSVTAVLVLTLLQTINSYQQIM